MIPSDLFEVSVHLSWERVSLTESEALLLSGEDIKGALYFSPQASYCYCWHHAVQAEHLYAWQCWHSCQLRRAGPAADGAVVQDPGDASRSEATAPGEQADGSRGHGQRGRHGMGHGVEEEVGERGL